MKKKFIFPLLMMVLLLSACGKRQVFLERHKFDNLRWNRFQNVYFEPEITDPGASYDIIVSIRHHTSYPYANLSMTLSIYTPAGERKIKNVDIYLRNMDGSFISQGNGDIWDYDFVLYKGYKFNTKGRYKFEFENRMPKFDTEGLMELGLIIRKSKPEE